MSHFKKSFFSNPYSLFAVFIFAVVVLVTVENCRSFQEPVQAADISNDVTGYYAYLPALFIYQDMEMTFMQQVHPELVGTMEARIKKTPIGKRIMQYNIGMAMMYAPFFTLAHATAPLAGQPQDGYNPHYQLFLKLGCIAYIFVGMLLLRKVLLRYYPDEVVAFTLLCTGLGTHLFYYTAHESMLTHGASFALFAAVIWVTERWRDRNRTYLYAAILGVLMGLIALVRLSNLLIVIIPMMVLLRNIRLLKWQAIVIAALCLLAVVSPQLAYWKIQTGHWLYNAYPPHERLIWSQPQLSNILWSYRKGWLVYTPMATFGLLGMIWVRKYAPTYFWALLVYIPLNLYVVSTWWNWWYGGSFGMRPLVEMSAPLTIGMAACWNMVKDSRLWLLKVLYGLALALIFLNLFQTCQYKRTYIHWNAMSQKAYWHVFGKTNLSDAERTQLESYLQHPDPWQIKEDYYQKHPEIRRSD